MPTTAEKSLTAHDVMKHSPISILENTSLNEAAAFLVDHGFTAAPVINEKGHAIGVLSVTDLLRYERAKNPVKPRPVFYETGNLDLPQDEPLTFKLEHADPTKVREVMSHAVYAVQPEAPLADVIEIMLQKKVHRLFVTDKGGTLVGVISTFDLLKKLAPGS